jgi:pimeloyl-ACP methyl ester carboxylesterase
MSRRFRKSLEWGLGLTAIAIYLVSPVRRFIDAFFVGHPLVLWASMGAMIAWMLVLAFRRELNKRAEKSP